MLAPILPFIIRPPVASDPQDLSGIPLPPGRCRSFYVLLVVSRKLSVHSLLFFVSGGGPGDPGQIMDSVPEDGDEPILLDENSVSDVDGTATPDPLALPSPSTSRRLRLANLEGLILQPLVSQSFEEDLPPVGEGASVFRFPSLDIGEFPIESVVVSGGRVRPAVRDRSPPVSDDSNGADSSVLPRPAPPPLGYRQGREVSGASRQFPFLVPYVCNLRLPSDLNVHFERLGENGQPLITLADFVDMWMEPRGEKMTFEVVYDGVLRFQGQMNDLPPADRIHVHIPVDDEPGSPLPPEPAPNPPTGHTDNVSCKSLAECHIRRLSQVSSLLSCRNNSFLQPFLHDEHYSHRVFLWHLAQARRNAPPGLMEVADHIMDTVDKETRIAGEC